MIGSSGNDNMALATLTFVFLTGDTVPQFTFFLLTLQPILRNATMR